MYEMEIMQTTRTTERWGQEQDLICFKTFGEL
jgi:hypothetical protein